MNQTETDKPKNTAAQKLGALGGRAGRGDAKRRSKEHYARIIQLRWAGKRKKDSTNACSELTQDVSSEDGPKTV